MSHADRVFRTLTFVIVSTTVVACGGGTDTAQVPASPTAVTPSTPDSPIPTPAPTTTTPTTPTTTPIPGPVATTPAPVPTTRIAAPSDYGFTTPDPEPALPTAMDVFNPPYIASGTGPEIAEFTRSGSPDDLLVLAGPRFTSSTTMRFFGQTGNSDALVMERLVSTSNGSGATVLLPANLPAWSTYLAWPVEGASTGGPALVNRTDGWWIGSDQAVAGQTVSVYGRNLSHGNGSTTAWVYIKPSGSTGQWLTPTAVSPYRVSFVVPMLAAGAYEVWAHNGHGGHFGWSGPLTLNLLAASPDAGQGAHVFNVASFGALGNGSNDDTDAIQRAIAAARAATPATLSFPAGSYVVNQSLACAPGVAWVGAGRDATTIRPGPQFAAAFTATGAAMVYCPPNVSGDNIRFQGITFDGSSGLGSGQFQNQLMKVVGHDNLAVTDCRFNWKGTVGGLSLAENRHVQITGTEFIGDGLFLGGTRQALIENNRFRLTDYAPAAVTIWGGVDVAVNANTAADFDPSASSTGGVGSGRFFTSQTHPHPNRNLYIGDNQTVNMAPTEGLGDPNQGEQILFEELSSLVAWQPVATTANTATFAAAVAMVDLLGAPIARRDAFIVDGRGVGQSREVVAVSGRTITVSPPWSVVPDATSTIGLGPSQTHAVIYRNALQGKPNYASYETASVGMNMYGNIADVVFADNTVNRTQGLVAEWSQAPDLQTPTPSALFFNLITRNTLSEANYGFGIFTSLQSNAIAGRTGHLGNSYRANRLSSVGIGIALGPEPMGYPGGDVALEVIEHNTMSNVAAVLKMVRPVYTSGPMITRFSDLNLYANVADRGAAAFAGSSVFALPGVTATFELGANSWTGYESTALNPLTMPNVKVGDLATPAALNTTSTYLP